MKIKKHLLFFLSLSIVPALSISCSQKTTDINNKDNSEINDSSFRKPRKNSLLREIKVIPNENFNLTKFSNEWKKISEEFYENFSIEFLEELEKRNLIELEYPNQYNQKDKGVFLIVSHRESAKENIEKNYFRFDVEEWQIHGDHGHLLDARTIVLRF